MRTVLFIIAQCTWGIIQTLVGFIVFLKELIKLKTEVKLLEEELINKNNIILEFQKISQLTKDKFETYLNKNNIQKKEFEIKIENYKNLQTESNNLKQKLSVLKNENNDLKKKNKRNGI